MLFPTTLVGSYPQPEWLIDRKKLGGRFPPRVRARELLPASVAIFTTVAIVAFEGLAGTESQRNEGSGRHPMQLQAHRQRFAGQRFFVSATGADGKAHHTVVTDRANHWIAAAGRRLGMSYKRAWLLVDTMNRCFAEPLVETVAGSGARVTAAGEAALANYLALAQGIALAGFVRLHELTGDAKWLQAAHDTYASFLVARQTGKPWVTVVENGFG